MINDNKVNINNWHNPSVESTYVTKEQVGQGDADYKPASPPASQPAIRAYTPKYLYHSNRCERCIMNMGYICLELRHCFVYLSYIQF